MPRLSLATIKDPEFINLKPSEISPLMDQCEIKVLYVGQNRNRSFISKEVATEMSKTLRGAPIVGWYRQEKEDFGDHGDRLTMDADGIRFESLTKPYGFVAPDAKVWFKEFEDTDEFGNKIVREYLMTTGYLWTKQYEEAAAVLKNGKPHSMELDNDSLDGKWATDVNSHMDFFIINDAVFSKLCILGDDIEPCFEGSNITAPEISKSFTYVEDFKKDLYTMMQQLKFALGGGESMTEEVKNLEFSADKDSTEQSTIAENQNFTKDDQDDKKDDYVVCNPPQEHNGKKNKDDYANNDGEDKNAKKNNDDNGSTSSGSEDKNSGNNDEKKDKNYTLLEEKFSALEAKYTALELNYNNLVAFKKEVENEKKDELIKTFYMLSDEDKKDVIENKEKYSLEEIESKLSVICVRKKVNFDLENNSNSDNSKEAPITYNLNNMNESVPAWVSAVRNTQNSRNN